MYAGLLNVLHDAADDHILAIADGVDIDLNGGIQEVVQQHRAVVGHQHRVTHVAHQLFFVVDDFHGTTTQHVGRTHHQRITDLTGRQNAFFVTAHGGVFRLFQTQTGDHLLEPLTVFGAVNGVRAGTDDGHTGGFQATGQLQWRLATVLHDHTLGLLDVNNFQHVFQGDRLKVQPVGGVVIGGHGLRVAVDHDGFVAVFTHGQGRVYTAVVEFDALANPVRATTDHHDLVAITGVRLALFLIGGVHVGGVGGKLGGTGIHPLVDRTDVQIVAQLAQADFRDAQQLGQTGIGEALALEAEQRGLIDVSLAGRLQRLLFPDQILDLHQVPGINLGVLEHVIHGVTGPERIADVPDAFGTGHVEFADQGFLGVLGAQVLQLLIEALGTHFQTAQGFLQGFLEGATDGHHLTHRFHLGGQAGVGLREFLEGKPGDLGDHVIDAGLERSRRDATGDFVAQLIEGVTHSQLGGNLGNREAGGLGRQRRGARHPRVHLDHHHATGVRVDTELNVRAAGFNTDLTQNRQRGVPHDLVFLVGQGLGRGHGDGVTGVYAHGIEVLDGTDDDAVVRLVADHFHLVFLPADQRFVDQQLVGRGQIQATGTDFFKLVPVVGDTATGTTHGERRADDAGEADIISDLPGLVHGVGDGGTGAFQTNLLHGLVEPVPVLGLVDGVGVGADHLNTVLFQHAMLFQVQRAVQGSLATHGRQQRVRLFFLNDLGDGFPGDRLDVGGVGHDRVGHDGRRVGVHQNNPVALFPQGLTGLCTRIVELARLPDHNRTRAQDQDALDVSTFWHVSVNLSATFRILAALMAARVIPGPGPGNLPSGSPGFH